MRRRPHDTPTDQGKRAARRYHESLGDVPVWVFLGTAALLAGAVIFLFGL